MRFVATGDRHGAGDPRRSSRRASSTSCRPGSSCRRRASSRSPRRPRQGRGAARAVEDDPALLRPLGPGPDEEVLLPRRRLPPRGRAIGWAPGVTSTRYAGVDRHGADEADYERLLGEISGLAGPLARRARFVCSVVAVGPDMTLAATGHWWAPSLSAARRRQVRLRPVFVPEGSDLSVAESPQDAKDQASHRALAGGPSSMSCDGRLLHGCKADQVD